MVSSSATNVLLKFQISFCPKARTHMVWLGCAAAPRQMCFFACDLYGEIQYYEYSYVCTSESDAATRYSAAGKEVQQEQ